MQRTSSIRALTIVLGLLTLAGTAPADESVPGADRSRSWRLSYRIPQQWVSDPDTAETMNLTALLLPEGETFQTADRIITVAYQEKRPGLPIPSTLRQFFDSEMSQLLRMFPDLDSRSWQPPSMEKTEFHYAGLEIFGDIPRSIRIIMVDAGDGFYSIHAQARYRPDLDGDDVRMFFDSLLFLPKRGRAAS
jgi:hypothetical protein